MIHRSPKIGNSHCSTISYIFEGPTALSTVLHLSYVNIIFRLNSVVLITNFTLFLHFPWNRL